jgi:hypothetical protein
LTPTNLFDTNPASTPLDVIVKIHANHALITEHLNLANVYQTTNHNRRTKPFDLQKMTSFGSQGPTSCYETNPTPNFVKASLVLTPFLQISSQAYRLPPSMQNHSVFHISKLK